MKARRAESETEMSEELVAEPKRFSEWTSVTDKKGRREGRVFYSEAARCVGHGGFVSVSLDCAGVRSTQRTGLWFGSVSCFHVDFQIIGAEFRARLYERRIPCENLL